MNIATFYKQLSFSILSMSPVQNNKGKMLLKNISEPLVLSSLLSLCLL